MAGTTMDFFESQARALRRTSLLVFLFMAAVAIIILAVWGAVVATLLLTIDTEEVRQFALGWRLFVTVGVITIAVVLGGTLTKIWALREGGSVVAMLLGGSPVNIDTKDHDERKLLNVVDEMTIASGCPPPSVFIIRRTFAINAFAAGFQPTDAAVVVTEGAMRMLTRDELQGVVAHEFSHIVNGDMRLNIRLMGVLHGILQIGVIGQTLLWAGAGGGTRRSSSRSDDRGGAWPLVVLGLVLLIVGYIGVFFGKLIKAAVSRQREYLADAAAVQYTRNPEGIAGALKKIGGLDIGSRVRASHAEEVSHFFFADGMVGSLMNFGGVLSTHPPLPERIKRVLPSFDGVFPTMKAPTADLYEGAEERAPKPGRERPKVAPAPVLAPPSAGAPGAPHPTPGPGMVLPPVAPGTQPPGYSFGNPVFPMTAAAVLAGAGRIHADKVDYARKLLADIPSSLHQRARTADGAQAIVFAMLLRQDTAYQQSGFTSRAGIVPLHLHDAIRETLSEMETLDPRGRVALVELSLRPLRQMSLDDVHMFLGTVRQLIAADQKTTLPEFMIEKALARYLDPRQRKLASRGPQFYSLKPLRGDVLLVLSALAHSGNAVRLPAEKAFAAGMQSLGPDWASETLLAREQCVLDAVSASFDRLVASSPPIKKKLIGACASVVTHDGEITIAESELIRAIGDGLQVPIPPLITAEASGAKSGPLTPPAPPAN